VRPLLQETAERRRRKERLLYSWRGVGGVDLLLKGAVAF
jgi:hypothetical protein